MNELIQKLPNFSLDRNLDILQGLHPKILDFHSLLDYLQYLDYQRISDPLQLNLILQEKRATCSTKHAFIKLILDQHLEHRIDLIIGIYKMNSSNTPGIKNTLGHYNLTYIPEAHCYLKESNHRFDFTFPDSNIEDLIPDILSETSIQIEQIAQYKVDLHKAFLQQWIQSEVIPYSLDEIWSIREACIQQLTQSN